MFFLFNKGSLRVTAHTHMTLRVNGHEKFFYRTLLTHFLEANFVISQLCSENDVKSSFWIDRDQNRDFLNFLMH